MRDGRRGRIRQMDCPRCGTMMLLKRTRTRRTTLGFDETTAWWTCDCGHAVRERDADPTPRGAALPLHRTQRPTRSPDALDLGPGWVVIRP